MGEGNIRWDDFFQTLKRINFNGYLGLDIGGDESDVEDLDEAYKLSLEFVKNRWNAR